MGPDMGGLNRMHMHIRYALHEPSDWATELRKKRGPQPGMELKGGFCPGSADSISSSEVELEFCFRTTTGQVDVSAWDYGLDLVHRWPSPALGLGWREGAHETGSPWLENPPVAQRQGPPSLGKAQGKAGL